MSSSTTYDKARRVDCAQDHYGRRTLFVYDLNDRVTRVARELIPNGAGTVPTDLTARDAYLNGLARLTTNNAPYIIETTEYNADGEVLARGDANNNRTTFAYDGQGRMREIVEAAGTLVAATTRYVYDAQGNRTRVIHPRTLTETPNVFYTDYAYTGRNLLASKTEAAETSASATEKYSYYLDGRIKDTTDARGGVWTTKWRNCCPQVVANIDPLAAVVPSSSSFILPPSSFGLTILGTDYADNATYSARVAESSLSVLNKDYYRNPTDASTINEVTTKYDARNRPVARTVWLTPLPATLGPTCWLNIAGGDAGTPTNYLKTTWVYDDNLSDKVGLDATYSSQLSGLGAGFFGDGADGSAVEETNAAGEKTVTVYDGLNRVVLTIDGLKNTTRVIYDNNNVGGIVAQMVETAVRDAAGHITKSRADDAGRIRESVDAESRVTKYGYDGNGNLRQVRDPNNVGYDAVYDARDRETTRVDTKGDRVVSREHDASSNVVKTKDALNNETLMAYDARDRKTRTTDRLSGVTAFGYDANNNLVSITDAELRNTSYVFDSRNLLIAETFPQGQYADTDENGDGYPDARTRVYSYDGARRLTSRLDQYSSASISSASSSSSSSSSVQSSIVNPQSSIVNPKHDPLQLRLRQSSNDASVSRREERHIYL